MDKKASLNPKLTVLAKSYLNRLKKSRIPVRQAFLFGSQVTGSAHKWSDLDLCVVSPAFGKDYHRELVELLILRDDESLIIEPHPYSPQDFENRFDPLAVQIKATGLRIA